MSRRRILNVTSIKKHDNMRQWLRSSTGSLSPGVISIINGAVYIYCPTARSLIGNAVGGESDRQRQLTFARGYKEVTDITVIGGASWRWRRIAVSFKGPGLLYDTTNTSASVNTAFYDDSDNGMTRVYTEAASSSQAVNWRTVLFDGDEGRDWSNPFVAKVDTSRVTLHYDRMVTINPGTTVGTTRSFRTWIPLNKNLLYDDDERGPGTNSSYVSVQSKIGMGDLYIFDYFNRDTGDNTGSLQLLSEATYYWHEK